VLAKSTNIGWLDKTLPQQQQPNTKNNFCGKVIAELKASIWIGGNRNFSS
jgi:hypothetical protein